MVLVVAAADSAAAARRGGGDMNIAKAFRHAAFMPWQTGRTFSTETLQLIEQAIADSDNRHAGEVRVVIEGALHPLAALRGQNGRDRAIEVFSALRIWDTEDNNGVLIYLLLAEHDIEIVADRGIQAHAGTAIWESLCQRMEARFGRGEFREGVLECIEAVTQEMARHCPPNGHPHNELPDRIVLL